MKIYKKGTKIRFFCCTHDVRSKEYYDEVLKQDFTEEELEKWAEEYFYEAKQPEWWFIAEGENGFNDTEEWN